MREIALIVIFAIAGCVIGYFSHAALTWKSLDDFVELGNNEMQGKPDDWASGYLWAMKTIIRLMCK